MVAISDAGTIGQNYRAYGIAEQMTEILNLITAAVASHRQLTKPGKLLLSLVEPTIRLQ